MTAIAPSIVSKSSSASLLSGTADLFSMLGIADLAGVDPSASTKPSRVICAVLDDSVRTHVRLGTARFDSASNAYHMLDGSLQVPEESKGKDGFFHTGSGVYAMMSESEFADMSRKSAMNAASKKLTSQSATAASEKSCKKVAAVAMASPVLQCKELTPAATATSNNLVEDIGCAAHALTRTVVVAGNFEGDATRLDVVMSQSRKAAMMAASHNNKVCYAFLGNVVPDVHNSTQSGEGIGSFGKIVDMSRKGIRVADNVVVMPDDVTLIAGRRELAWLRLANVSASREITRFDDPRAAAVLTSPTPFAEADGLHRLPNWKSYNESLRELPNPASSNVVAVLMLLKLLCMASSTMNAPGLVSCFAARLSEAGVGDAVSFISLRDFLSSFSGTVSDGLSKLIHPVDKELTPEGLGLMPAAKIVVNEVLNFASTTYTTYMRKCKLVHCISAVDMDGDGGLWLHSIGTSGGRAVGKLPVGVDADSLSVRWNEHSAFKVQWASDANKQFNTFFKRFVNGDVDLALYECYIAMSIETYANPLPLAGFRANSTSSCQGVVADKSIPFGTITRRILVDGSARTRESDLVRVLESWSNINTDAYTPSTFWSVATWCGGTKSDLAVDKPPINCSESISSHLYNVSVTLASLLSIRLGEKNVSEFGLSQLSGIVGPLLSSSSAQRQAMRIVSFTHPDVELAFVVKLPEAFVQYCLDYYNYDYDAVKRPGEPYLFTEGFIALPDESAVPLDLPGLSATEVGHLRNELGTRVWALPQRRSARGMVPFNSSDYSAITTMLESPGPGKSTVIPGYTVIHTRLSDSDAFAGLHISLARVPGLARMTIDTDTSEFQRMFRKVAKRK